MKFFVAFLALPAAVLAAPTSSSSSSFDSLACGCVNAKGDVYNSSCLAMAGTSDKAGELAGYCYRAASWAPEMDQVFTEAFCKQDTGPPGYTKAVCKPIKLCVSEHVDYYYHRC